ncbi:MAG: hypothetical protein WC785_04335 [Tatlockia sp.]|jgi:hypothetical protein
MLGPHLTALLTHNSQFDIQSDRFNHEAIALFLKHQLKTKKEQVFVLAGSEDLCALLPNLHLDKSEDEAFILIRPYIHSMGLYFHRSAEKLICVLFDSQGWGLRYYPTRLILDAIRAQFPDALLYLTNEEIQPQNINEGCVHYSFAFLAYCSKNKVPNQWDANEKQALSGYTHCYTIPFPPPLRNALVYPNTPNAIWIKTQAKENAKILEEIIKTGYLVDGLLDWRQIHYAVEEMQGLHLLYDSLASYAIVVNTEQKSLRFQFATKDFIYSNCLSFSKALFPIEAQANLQCVFDDNPLIRINMDMQNFCITYQADDFLTLQNAFYYLNSNDYWQKHLRQKTALKALTQRVRHAIELNAICKDNSGGLDQYLVQSALQYYFSQTKGVFVPSIESYENLKYLDFNVLIQGGTHAIAFSHAVDNNHQVAVWLALDKAPFVATVFDSLQKPMPADNPLAAFLGLDSSQLTIEKGLSPFPLQTDNWSCGVYVVANLLRVGNQSNEPFNAKAMASSYLSAALFEKNRKKLLDFNLSIKRSLLYVLSEIPFSIFEDVTDFLQVECFGDGETVNPHIAARPLTGTLNNYAHSGDKPGDLLLKAACLLQTEPGFDEKIKAVMQRIATALSLKEKTFFSSVKGKPFTNKETAEFVESLIFDLGAVRNHATLLSLLHTLLKNPIDFKTCFSLIDFDFPLTEAINIHELAYELMEGTLNALISLEQSMLAEISRKSANFLHMEEQKKEVLAKIESLLSQPLSEVYRVQIDESWLPVLLSLSNGVMTYLTPKENDYFIAQLIQQDIKSIYLAKIASLLTDEQLATILPHQPTKTNAEKELWFRIVQKPGLLQKALGLLPKNRLLALMHYTNGSDVPLFHVASEIPDSLEIILEAVTKPLRLSLFKQVDLEGNTIFHKINGQSFDVALNYLTKKQLLLLITIQNYSGETIFTQNGLCFDTANRILQFLASNAVARPWNIKSRNKEQMKCLLEVDNKYKLFKTFLDIANSEKSLFEAFKDYIKNKELDLSHLSKANNALAAVIKEKAKDLTYANYQAIHTRWEKLNETIHALNSTGLHLYFPLTAREFQVQLLTLLQERVLSFDLMATIDTLSVGADKTELLIEVLFKFNLTVNEFDALLSLLPAPSITLIQRAILEKRFTLLERLIHHLPQQKKEVLVVLQQALLEKELDIEELTRCLMLNPESNLDLLSVFLFRISHALGYVIQVMKDSPCQALKEAIYKVAYLAENYEAIKAISPYVNPTEYSQKEFIACCLLKTDNPYHQLERLTRLFTKVALLNGQLFNEMKEIINEKLVQGEVLENYVLKHVLEIHNTIFIDRITKEKGLNYFSSVLAQPTSEEEKLAQLIVFLKLVKYNIHYPVCALNDLVFRIGYRFSHLIDNQPIGFFHSFKMKDTQIEARVLDIAACLDEEALQTYTAEDYEDRLAALNDYSGQLAFLEQLAKKKMDIFQLTRRMLQGSLINLYLQHRKHINIHLVLKKMTRSSVGMEEEQERILIETLLLSQPICFELVLDTFITIFPKENFMERLYDKGHSLIALAMAGKRYPLANFLINLPEKYPFKLSKHSLEMQLIEALEEDKMEKRLLASLVEDTAKNEALLLEFLPHFPEVDLIKQLARGVISSTILLQALENPKLQQSPWFIEALTTLPMLDEAIHQKLKELFIESIANKNIKQADRLYYNYIIYNESRYFNSKKQFNPQLVQSIKQTISGEYPLMTWYTKWLRKKASSFPHSSATYDFVINAWQKRKQLFELFCELDPENSFLLSRSYLHRCLVEYLFDKQEQDFNLEEIIDCMVNHKAHFTDVVTQKKTLLTTLSQTTGNPELLKLIQTELEDNPIYSSNSSVLKTQFFVPFSTNYLLTETNDLKFK